jgi:hypothetical protein
MQTTCQQLFRVIYLPKHCAAVQLLTAQYSEIFESEQSGQGQGNDW